MDDITRRRLLQSVVVSIGAFGSTSGIACMRASSSKSVSDASSSFAEMSDIRRAKSDASIASFVVMSDLHIDEELTRSVDHLKTHWRTYARLTLHLIRSFCSVILQKAEKLNNMRS